MTGIDISRLTSGVVLPEDVSQDIWSDTQQASAVMQLARQTRLPGSGITIPIITGDATADWVDETDEISVSRATVDSKSITPYKLAVIEPFSKEFLRDLPGLYAELKNRLPGAIATKFDATVFGSSAPGSNFATLGSATADGLTPHATDVKKGSWAGLVAAVSAVAGNNGTLNGWALSSQAQALLLNQVDSTGRPLLVDSIANGSNVPLLVGKPVVYTQAAYASGSPNRLGFAGDWSSAVWGAVSGIQISMSDQASITDGTVDIAVGEDTATIPNVINLWQRDMFALRVTVELGFQVRNVNRFVKLTDTTRS